MSWLQVPDSQLPCQMPLSQVGRPYGSIPRTLVCLRPCWGHLCLLQAPGGQESPAILFTNDWEEVWLTGKENCGVSSFWWVLHSFLVKYCTWKTRIYGQHSSYKRAIVRRTRMTEQRLGGGHGVPSPSIWSQHGTGWFGTRRTRGCRCTVLLLYFQWGSCRSMAGVYVTVLCLGVSLATGPLCYMNHMGKLCI